MVRSIRPDEARVVLDGALVREPQQRPPVVAQRVGHLALGRLRPDVTVCTQDGVYLGTFFCMKGAWPRCARMTDSGRSASTGTIRPDTASR